MTSGDKVTHSVIIPSVSSTVRNSMVADKGTLIFNVTTSKLNFCKTKAAAAASWEAVTSVEEA